MKTQEPRDLFPGALEMMILQTLRGQPLHGYALVQQIKRSSNELLKIEEGSLYPALQRLLKEGLVSAEWGVSSTNRRVRIYKLTPNGVQHLAREVSRFEQMFEGITRVSGGGGGYNGSGTYGSDTINICSTGTTGTPVIQDYWGQVFSHETAERISDATSRKLTGTATTPALAVAA